MSSARITTAYRLFAAYINQADTYWKAAQNTGFKSSSLLYYYSFLNLAKALLVLKNPSITTDLRHGLSFKPVSGGFARQKIAVQRNGDNRQVFHFYYNHIFNQNPPGELNLLKIIGYVSDVSLQYHEGGFGKQFIAPFYYRNVGSQPTSNAWSVVAIHRIVNPNAFSGAYSGFVSNFREVALPSPQALQWRELLGFEPYRFDMNNYRFYESVAEYPDAPNVDTAMQQAFKQCLKGWVHPTYADYFPTGFLSIPQTTRSTQPFNEEIAIYSVMFAMSSLVRYQPQYLERLLKNKPAWLLESFVTSAPTKFLSAITARITDTNMVLVSRLF